MKLRVFLLLSAALAATTFQAVVQPGRNQQLFNHNRNGYRYNGPAHKYLPAQGPPSTEAGIITGPWQSHGSHGNQIPQSLEHSHGANHQQQHGYNGPYNNQYYGGHEQHRQEEHSWKQKQQFGQQQNHQQIGEPWQSSQGLGQDQGFQQHQEQQYHQQQSQSHHHQGHQEVEYAPEQHGRPGQHHQQGLLQQEPHDQRAESWQPSHEQGFQHEQHREGQHQQQPHHQQEHHDQQEQQQGVHWQPSDLAQNSDRFPSALAHATSHKTVAAPARDIKLVPAYTLSSYSDQDRFIGLDALDTRLLSQSLPEAYQRVPFNTVQPSSHQPLGQVQGQRHEELLGGSPRQQESQGYVQMQSHSYELPSSHTMQREWPQQLQQQQQSHSSGNRQYSESAFAFSSNQSPGSSSHSSNPAVHPSNPSIHSSNPSYSFQNSLSHPSREFQPPYYR
ncbi:GL14236 [Drosophila persimilis]|uniref:GL14236 n=1 Tax=Drosophila persimilis TaxID=7234 RepID=B4GTP8_DROPE|nr:GL14236 [Drosophila persimilis]